VGKARIYIGQLRSHRKRQGPIAPQFWGIPFYVCVHPLTQNDRGEWLDFRRSATPLLKGSELQSSPTLGFSCIYVYTLWRRTIPNSAL